MMRGLEYAHRIEYTVDGERVHLATIGGNVGSRRGIREADRDRRCDGGPSSRSPADQGRSARGRRRLRRGSARRRHGPAAAVSAQLVRHARLDRPAAHRDVLDLRTVQSERSGRHAEPAADLLVPARVASGRDAVRPAHPGVAGPPRLSPDADADGSRSRVDVLRSGQARGVVRNRHPGARCSSSWRAPTSCSASSAIRTRSRPGAAYRLGDIELASRLSFFLWSSIPDDELLDVAARGRLKDPAVREQQVRRMLADPRSHALVSNFAGQWLQLRNVRTVLPNSEVFPDFDDNLREAFLRETELLFDERHARGSQRPRSAARRLHLRQRTARAALRHPEHLRQSLPPRRGRRRGQKGAARPRQHPGDHVARRAHLAGPARQVDSREPARHAAAAAARRRAGARGQEREGPDRARAAWSSIARIRSARAVTR